LKGAEVVVQTHPLALDDETILDRVQIIAAAQGVPVHHVTVQHVEERISVSPTSPTGSDFCDFRGV
jgi:hypothetical protein